jgi:hypothetical protein
MVQWGLTSYFPTLQGYNEEGGLECYQAIPNQIRVATILLGTLIHLLVFRAYSHSTQLTVSRGPSKLDRIFTVLGVAVFSIQFLHKFTEGRAI